MPTSAPSSSQTMPHANPFDALRSGGAFTVLDQFDVIEASGIDATTFLHNQLTQDVKNLSPNQAQLAGLCSVKGRLLASFLFWHTNETIQLMLPSDLRADVQKRLSMFILRSKVKLNDTTSKLALIGLMGNVEPILASLFPTIPQAKYEKAESAAGTLIRLTDVSSTLVDAAPTTLGPTRYLWITTQEASDVHTALLASHLTRVPSTVWDWCDIQAGIPRITQATQEKFVPQMVNFELIGGINFRKGCWPGQEVVARLQFRGVVRRRTFLAHIEFAQPGVEIYHSEEPSQACGIIVNAAPAPTGGVDCLVQLQLSMLKQGVLHAGSADGPILELLSLPYEIPEMA